jgi:hypothetical protein
MFHGQRENLYRENPDKEKKAQETGRRWTSPSQGNVAVNLSLERPNLADF